MSNIIETIEEIKVYENRFVTVYDDKVRFPSGNRGTYFRYRWKAPYGVAILPIFEDQAVLIETYRYSEKARSIEVPQGFGVENSSPELDAHRELQEETGLTAKSLEFVGVVGGDFKTHLFVANVDCDHNLSNKSSEDTEVILGKLFVKKTEVDDLLSSGEMFDCISLYLLSRFFNK